MDGRDVSNASTVRRALGPTTAAHSSGASASQRVTRRRSRARRGRTRRGPGRSGRRLRACGPAACRCGGRGRGYGSRTALRAPGGGPEQASRTSGSRPVVCSNSSRTSSSSARSGRESALPGPARTAASAARTGGGAGRSLSSPVTSGSRRARAAGPCSRRRSTYSAAWVPSSGWASMYSRTSPATCSASAGVSRPARARSTAPPPSPGRARRARRAARTGSWWDGNTSASSWTGSRGLRRRTRAARPEMAAPGLRVPDEEGVGGGVQAGVPGALQQDLGGGAQQGPVALGGDPLLEESGVAGGGGAAGGAVLVAGPALDGPAERGGLVLREGGEQLPARGCAGWRSARVGEAVEVQLAAGVQEACAAAATVGRRGTSGASGPTSSGRSSVNQRHSSGWTAGASRARRRATASRYRSSPSVRAAVGGHQAAEQIDPVLLGQPEPPPEPGPELAVRPEVPGPSGRRSGG